MSNSTATPITAEKNNVKGDAKQSVIENHKKAALHHEATAKNHNDAAKFRQEGNDEKASESTVKAHGHHALASEHQRQAVKNNSWNSNC